ncbi:MAG: sugar ABC transporter ATP-binding protein [Clostridiales bacterium]|nr:sugar ABC transporter ATP-binding protein [Clostridiales bacterium]
MEYIELRNIVKTFYGVKALDDVSLSMKKSEVHAVVGENGAGKSTVMKILGGLYFADRGDIYIDGKPRHINNVQAALKNGISVVHQELHYMPELSVAENIYLHDLPVKAGFIDKKTMNKNAQALLDGMNVDIKATTPMSLLSVSEQQMVEIAKALSHDTDIVIMDEPTAALNVKEVDALYGIVAGLKAKGKTVIYISHRLKEIFDICDRVSVLRDGKYMGTRNIGEINQDQLVEMMVGREISQYSTTADHEYGETVLKVRNLTKEGLFSDISFDLHKGEVLGIAGLMGCFREDIVKSLYGLIHPDSGEIELEGQTVYSGSEGVNLISTPRKAIGRGIGYVTEDRKNSGIFALMTARENLTISIMKFLAKFGLVRARSEQELLDDYTAKMNMKYRTPHQRINSLSGGNQQKFILARTLSTNCRVLITLEPTRGIDVGAKSEIFALLEDLAKSGVAIIVISSELQEIISNCHRTLVIFQGALTGEINKEDFEETLIMQCATGNEVFMGKEADGNG